MSRKKKFTVNKKSCTKCGLKTALARKVCLGCNAQFYSSEKSSDHCTEEYDQLEVKGASITPAAETYDVRVPPDADAMIRPIEENGRRRTERVRRGKPHFYDASEFQIKNKNKPKKNRKAKGGKPGEDSNAKYKTEKKYSRELEMRETLAKAKDKILYTRIMTPRKDERLALILEEINYKVLMSSWKPS